MNTSVILLELYDRKRRLEEAISLLEELNRGDTVRAHSNRGRKSMGAEERREVSKRYWASRRQAR